MAKDSGSRRPHRFFRAVAGMALFGTAGAAVRAVVGRRRRGAPCGSFARRARAAAWRRTPRSSGAGTATLEAPPRTLADNLGAVLRFVVPALGSAMLAPLLDATDALVVGRFGSTVDLAALSPSMAASDMIWLLFTFLSATTANMLARARGRGDFASARNMLSDACCLAVCCGVVVGSLVAANCGSVLKLLISPAALAATAGPAAAYIYVRAFFFPVQLLQLVLSAACFSALQDTVTPLRASALGGLANLVIDLVLIAGCGLGCVGAAIGTVSGQLVAVALLVRALRRNHGFGTSSEASHSKEALSLLASPRTWLQSLRAERMKPLLAFAAPFLTFQLMKVLLMTFETRMGSAFGPTSLAAHQVTYSMWRFLITLCDPIMQAAQALVPVHYATGTAAGRLRARELGQATLVVAVALGLLSGVLGLAFSAWLPPIFTPDATVVKEATGLALPMAASVVALSVWHCNEGLMLATGRARLLAGLYTWNVLYFTTGSHVVLSNGLKLFHSWVVFASMHAIFALMISVVLRLPGGLFFRLPSRA